jgi:hypothetical protein
MHITLFIRTLISDTWQAAKAIAARTRDRWHDHWFSVLTLAATRQTVKNSSFVNINFN